MVTDENLLARTVIDCFSASRALRFRATSLHQYGTNLDQYHIDVDANRMAWQIRGVTGDLSTRFNPDTTTITSQETETKLGLAEIPNRFHESVRLAFPSSLPVWGRTHDDYSPVGAEKSDGEVIILLRHRTDLTLFASVVIDRSRSIATAMTTPSDALRLVDIEEY